MNCEINPKDLQEFVDLKKMGKRFRELSNTDLEGYLDKQKLAIKTFLDFCDGKEKLDD